ncbi:MAG: hypothetical protein PF503_10945 [Desulfobacula sp.]|jgi:hypothetical protein|nr:hypothetical protein [Desulfobacula sp.]
MKFLFWNMKNRPLVKEVAELIIESKCDICTFSEITDETLDQVTKLLFEKYNIEYYRYPTPGCERVKLIVTGQVEKISLLNQHKYYSLIKICRDNQKLIIGFVHFPSKFHHHPDELRRASEILRNQIFIEEKKHAINDSMVMGDFNVDPFEKPMVSFSGMGATNGIACSRREMVTRSGESNRLFYNPMWTLYSSYKDRPGSHRYNRLGEDVVSWHFLDQVLIRPTLIDKFKFEALMLIKGTKNYNYLNANQSPNLSDHLPLMCEIEY